jgi:hypothetical protein
MTMVYQPSQPPSPEEKALGDIMCNCHATTPRSDDDDCKRLGDRKHDCCAAAIQNAKKPPNIGGEQGYDKAGNKLTQTRAQAEASGSLKDTAWPDACAQDAAGNPTQFFDFKFVCPRGVPNVNQKTGKIIWSSGSGSPGGDFYMRKGGKPSQFEKYRDLGKKLNPPTTKDPKPLESSACR